MNTPAASIVESVITGKPIVDVSPAAVLAAVAGAAAGAKDERGKKWGVGVFSGVGFDKSGFRKEAGIELRRHVGSIDLYGTVSRNDVGAYAARAGLTYNF